MSWFSSSLTKGNKGKVNRSNPYRVIRSKSCLPPRRGFGCLISRVDSTRDFPLFACFLYLPLSSYNVIRLSFLTHFYPGLEYLKLAWTRVKSEADFRSRPVRQCHSKQVQTSRLLTITHRYPATPRRTLLMIAGFASNTTSICENTRICYWTLSVSQHPVILSATPQCSLHLESSSLRHVSLSTVLLVFRRLMLVTFLKLVTKISKTSGSLLTPVDTTCLCSSCFVRHDFWGTSRLILSVRSDSVFCINVLAFLHIQHPRVLNSVFKGAGINTRHCARTRHPIFSPTIRLGSG